MANSWGGTLFTFSNLANKRENDESYIIPILDYRVLLLKSENNSTVCTPSSLFILISRRENIPIGRVKTVTTMV